VRLRVARVGIDGLGAAGFSAARTLDRFGSGISFACGSMFSSVSSGEAIDARRPFGANGLT